MRTLFFLLASAAAIANVSSQTPLTTALGKAQIGTYTSSTHSFVLKEALASAYLSEKHPYAVISEVRIEAQGAHGYLVYKVEKTRKDDSKHTVLVAEEICAAPGSGSGIAESDIGGEEHECDGACTGSVTILSACRDCSFARDGNGKITGCQCSASGVCCHKVKSSN